ncbi:histone H3-5-like [Diabrotica virgifera virgifera]|uniref:Histone H3-5-like n=1 Tax=Diabrotica virgifera virgifera TaxID=50390 RepID=A0A6P7GAF5_DIAVI|nr:histone H3-5-like [Diabrotica virgifera virgifera]
MVKRKIVPRKSAVSQSPSTSGSSRNTRTSTSTPKRTRDENEKIPSRSRNDADTPSKSTPNVSKNKRKSGKRKKVRQVTQMSLGRKYFKVSNAILRDIGRLQRAVTNCIPKLPFSRVIREILLEQGHTQQLRIQIEALTALQEAAEIYLINLFEDANRCAAHARRITVMPRDIQLTLELRGPNEVGRY